MRSVHGIGEETADSIILYAAKKPSVVIDAYARRIMQRLGSIKGKESYAALRTQFMENTQRDVKLYNCTTGATPCSCVTGRSIVSLVLPFAQVAR